MNPIQEPILRPAESPIPPPQSGDPFDKALALAQYMADRELATLDRNQQRFFYQVKIFVIVAVAGLTFLGWRTVVDFHKQVTRMVNVELTGILPQMVAQEVKEQFGPDNVRRVVDEKIRGEAGFQIQKLVEKQVGVAVSAAVRTQRQEIEHAVGLRLTHYLSFDQQAALVPTLRQMAPQAIRILTDQDQDRVRYAGDLAQAFRHAGWTVEGDDHVNLSRSSAGVYVGRLSIHSDPQHPFTSTDLLISALRKTGLKTTYTGKNEATLKGGRPCLTLEILEQKN